MTSPIRKLRDKLCRELAQTEQSAAVHCAREARRYGALPPGELLRAISEHAEVMRPSLRDLLEHEQSFGARLGRGIGEGLSTLRHLAIDRVVDAERSYRATLLGVRHGIDVARMLREVLAQQEPVLADVCDELIEGRLSLVVEGERLLGWFAHHPDIALRTATTLAA